MSYQWIIKYRISAPMEMLFIDDDGNFLQTAQFKSWPLNENRMAYQGSVFYFSASPSQVENSTKNINGEFFEQILLCCETNAQSSDEAIDNTLNQIEWICDQLAFCIQRPITYDSVTIESMDDESNIEQFILPKQPPKFRNEAITNSIVGKNISIQLPPSNFTEREFAMFRWYHKSLSANYDIDKFVFLWICLEIQLKIFGNQVKSYYQAPCNHLIKSCPDCGTSTERETNGNSLKNLLESELGVTNDIAKELWRFRQFIHGQNKMTTPETERMKTLVMYLQSATNTGIKKIIGLKDDSPPIVETNGNIFSSISLHISR